MNIPLTITCRSYGQEGYGSPAQCGLQARRELLDGDGSAGRPFRVRVSIRNPLSQPWMGIVHFQLSAPAPQARFFLPAFLYGWNQGEKPLIPGAKWNPRIHPAPCELPYSPYWMVRADRLSHPVAMMWHDKHLLGISAAPWREEHRQFAGFNGFSCSLGQTSTVGYTLGYEDTPCSYVIGQEIQIGRFDSKQCLCLEGGEERAVCLMIYDLPCPEIYGISNVIRDVYMRWHQPPRKGGSIQECIHDIASAIDADSWMQAEKNYATMVALRNGVIEQVTHTSIGWTGGAEIAMPMLMAAYRLKDTAMRTHALQCIQEIVEKSLNPDSGLPYESCREGIWSVEGWWQSLLPRHGHTAYVTGQALYSILKAYEWERDRFGTLHEDWLSFVKAISDRMEKTKNGQGEYPYVWSQETGEPLEYDSFAGCWCLAVRVLLAKITGSMAWLEDCRTSEQHYFDAYVRRMECYATPIDTFRAVDSEGILAYIRAVRMLYTLTGEDCYLQRLGIALDYEFTFKFCYNVPIQTPPLSKLGWSCCGGSVTSTANPHIHPMSSGILDELLFYAVKTQDGYYQQRLKDVCDWNLQTYSRFDGEYDFGKKGWLSERFCYSEGLLTERYPDGSPASVWFYFLPWGAANILEGMCADIFEVWKEDTH